MHHIMIVVKNILKNISMMHIIKYLEITKFIFVEFCCIASQSLILLQFSFSLHSISRFISSLPCTFINLYSVFPPSQFTYYVRHIFQFALYIHDIFSLSVQTVNNRNCHWTTHYSLSSTTFITVSNQTRHLDLRFFPVVLTVCS